jgi:hypothetical protein
MNAKSSGTLNGKTRNLLNYSRLRVSKVIENYFFPFAGVAVAASS